MPDDPFAGRRLAALSAAFAHLKQGRFAAAAAAVAPLLDLHPVDAEALLLRGLARAGAGTAQDAASGAGTAQDAASDLLRVAGLRPDAAHPLLDVLTVLRPLGALSAAAPVLRAAVAQAPHDGALLSAAAQAWLDLGEPGAALALLDRLVWHTAQPATAKTLVLRGIVRCEANDFAGGIADFHAALALEPNDVAALGNLGLALAVEHRFELALDCFAKACRLAPGDVRLQVNRALALLKAGRWEEGLVAFERFRPLLPGRASSSLRPLLRSFTEPPPPLLEPGMTVNGRAVLLTHEEGLGDTLQYMRFVPLLAEQGARVLVLVPAALARIAARLDGVAEVVTDGARLPPFDLQAPFPRLPLIFGVRPDSLPAGIYLDAEDALAAAWASRLPPRAQGTRRIGLVWAGLARDNDPAALAVDRHRSLRLADLAPFSLIPNAQLISLQMGPPAAQPPPPGLQIHDPMPLVRDFADTAAIIANLDVVVSVDTAVVHLAGAMGKPVMMLDRYDHCWRWAAIDGVDGTLWYDRQRILRQEIPGDWSAPLARAVASLMTP